MPELLSRWARLVGLTALCMTILSALFQADIMTTALLCVIATGALWIATIFDDRAGGLDFLVTFFFLFFIAVPARLQIAHQTFPWGGSYSTDLLNQTYALVSVALLCYALARLTPTKRGVSKVSESRPPNLHRWAFLFTLFAIALAALIGPAQLFVLRSGFLEGATHSLTSQLIYIGRALTLLSLVCCLYLWRQPLVRTGPTLMVTAFAALAFISFNYPPALPRFALFGCLIAVASVYLNLFSPRLKLTLALTAPPLLLLIFPAAKVLGHADVTVAEMLAIAIQRDLTSYLLRVDFDAFKQIADTLLYLETAPPRWGANYLGVVLFFVPRALWPGKPIDSGALVSSTLGYEYTNVSSPLPAEALLAFGLPGVLITFLFLGWMTAQIEGQARLGNTLQHLVLYSITMGFITIILRGALNGVAPQFATAFLGYALLTWRSKA